MDNRRATVRFGIFEVDLGSGELRKQGIKIKLQEQPFQALVALIERPREILTREELQERLWPADKNVDFERGINKAINRLRDALGDDADNPRFIETLPQRGYRFVAPVELVPAEVTPAEPVAPQPVRRRGVLAMAGGLIAVPLLALAYRLGRSSPPKIESIAVLPLENLSRDPAQEYFSDGMTDELIGEIARIGALRVISRTSVMQYKGGARKSLPLIARELNVDAILEGTVLQSGQKVRITAQLIRAQDDRHLWSESYERDLTDILALQSEVARTVAREIQVKLTPGEQINLARTRPGNPEAYEAFLQGSYYLNKGARGILKSIDYFTQAVKLDPLHAESHAGLAQVLCFAGIFGFRPSAETHPAARVSALKALSLDESNASAHSVLADVKKGYDWDSAGALPEYGLALKLNPSHQIARIWYAECLNRLLRNDEAIAESVRVLALDPVSPIGHNLRAMLFYRSRRYDEAIQAAQKALELDPQFLNALWWQGLSYAGEGDYSKSIACLTRAAAMNNSPMSHGYLGFVYGRAGQRTVALGILEKLTAMSKQRYVSPMEFAVVYGGLGDAHSTFEWLEKAYRTRATRIHELPSIYFESVHSDPRYAELLKRVGLPG